MDDNVYTIITDMVIIILIVIFLLLAWHFWKNHEEIVLLEKQCEKTPSLRYAQTCTTKEDCIRKCALRLQENIT